MHIFFIKKTDFPCLHQMHSSHTVLRQPFIKHLCCLLYVLLMCVCTCSSLSNVFALFTGLPPKQSSIVPPPFEPNTSCSSSRNSHADGLHDKTCGNRLSEGSQPATREVTQEVKLSLSVPLRVRVDHKPYRARNQNNKGAIVGGGARDSVAAAGGSVGVGKYLENLLLIQRGSHTLGGEGSKC